MGLRGLEPNYNWAALVACGKLLLVFRFNVIAIGTCHRSSAVKATYGAKMKKIMKVACVLLGLFLAVMFVAPHHSNETTTDEDDSHEESE